MFPVLTCGMFLDNCHLIGTGFTGAIPLFLMLGWWKQSGVLATIALVMSWFAAIVSWASAVQDFVFGLRLRGSQSLTEDPLRMITELFLTWKLYSDRLGK